MPKREIEPFYTHLGQRLREARLAKGLTQQEVGAFLGLTGPVITYYESGTNRVRTLELVQMCAVLDISVGELLNDMVKTSPELFEPHQATSIGVRRKRARAAAQAAT